MKKFIFALLAFVLVVSLFFAGTPKTAQALAGNGYDDTTPPFTTSGSYSVIDSAKFTDGTVEVNERYFPKWENEGEVEYHYNVLHVYGLNGQYTTAKFIFKQWYFGWEGAIYRWNGTKWVKVPTTMELGVEDGGTFATANVTDGYYALLVWYSGVEKPR